LAYDLNGLELSEQINNTLSAYKHVAYDLTSRKYIPITHRHQRGKSFNMLSIHHGMNTPLEAAFVAQRFNEEHDRDFVESLSVDGKFREYVKQFIADLEIPEFKYPPEGYLIEDYLNDYRLVEAKQARCDDAKSALAYIIKQNELPVPPLKQVSKFVKKVETAYEGLNNWITAAEAVMLKGKRI